MTKHPPCLVRAALAAPLILACVLACVQTAEARSWLSDAFAANRGRPERILVLPPSASIVRAKVNDSEPLFDESGDLGDELLRALAADLGAAGYVVDTTSASVERQAADRDLQAAVAQVELRLGEVMAQVAHRPKDIREGRYTIDDAALSLRAATGADGLLFVESQSVIPSKGAKALGVIFGGAYYLPTQTRAVGILVDARTGVVEAVMVGSSLGPVLKRPARVADTAIKSLLDTFPRRGEAKRVKQRKNSRAADEDDEEELDEQAVLAEFELLRAKRTAARGSQAPAPGAVEEIEEDEDPAELVLPANRDFLAPADGQPPGNPQPVLSPAPSPAPPAPPPPVAAPPRAMSVPPPTPLASAPGPTPPASAPVATPEPPAPTAPAAMAPRAAVEPEPQAPARAARPAAPSPVRREAPATPAPSTEDPAARALYRTPADQRPPAVFDVSFTGGTGGPAVLLVNGSERDVRVSVAFAPFVSVPPHAPVRVDAKQGTAWILVTDAAGHELARAACTVAADGLVTVDLAPR